jgi:hypothetical protein
MEEACGSVTSTHSGLCTTESGIGQSEDIVLIYTCNPFPALQVKETELIIPPPLPLPVCTYNRCIFFLPGK